MSVKCGKLYIKLTTVFVLVFSLLLSVNVFATVSGDNPDGVQGLVYDGTLDDFARRAPISTINIDLSKCTGMELDYYQANSAAPNGFELDGNGNVIARDVLVKGSSWSYLNNFTLIYKNAAIMSTGETRDLEIVFNDASVIGRSSNGDYRDNITFAKINSSVNGGPAITPLSEVGKHFAFRSNVKFRIGKAGEMTGNDTFLITAYDINNNRESLGSFMDLTFAGSNYGYSESAEPSSGINAESDFYVPTTYYERIESGNSGSPNPTYGSRLVGLNGGTSISQKNYNSGFATVGDASGFISRFWSSAGTNILPLEIYLMPGGISHTSKSASGDGGKIELWTSGKIDDTNATYLVGGTINAPRTYVVPNGKSATYKMVPEADYEIDKLMVNGAEATATPVIENGKIVYYTYFFDIDVVTEQEIIVTWKTDKVPEPAAPDTGSNTEINNVGSNDTSYLMAFNLGACIFVVTIATCVVKRFTKRIK